jgi:hypothetical protein
VSGRDITEGRATRAIAVDIGNLTGTVWQNTGVDYDIAIGGVPFLLDATETHPYERSTAPFRKNQFDTQRDPGEQSLQGWWFRSQSSFHAGQGVKFYDPFANPFSTTLASNSYRYGSSFGVNPFTFGQVTLLNSTTNIKSTTAAKHLESASISGTDYVIMLDTNIVKVDASGTSTTLATASNPIYSFTTDGTNLYYLDSAHFNKVPLAGGSTTQIYAAPSSVTSSAMHWVKQRLVSGVNNVLYEIVGTSNGNSLPTSVYTHPNTAWQWTDIDEAGPAIYASGYAGTNSAIYMFVLNSSGSMPVLTSGIVAAQLPAGEVIYSMYSHLGEYLLIGTNKGVRVAAVDQATGYLTYGPLIVATANPVRGFGARDSYVWFGDSVSDGTTDYAGCWRIDLSNEVDTLRFAVAQDIYASNTPGTSYDVAFMGSSNRLAFLASNSADAPSGLGLWLQDASNVVTSGWVQTGYIRYNTLELKNFKRIVGRGDFGIAASTTYPNGSTKGSMTIASVDSAGNQYDIVSYDNNIGTPEATISNPIGAQDAIALRFTLFRDATDTTVSPIFKGYQLKAVPATPRTRIIKIPLLCFDVDTDKYNATVGYEGYAYDRLAALETIEANGDVVTLQDFRTGETVQCLIEELSFINKISPDKRLNNFAGTIILTVRTV